MSKYRKKLVVIDAVKFDGRNWSAIAQMAGDSPEEFFEDWDGEPLKPRPMDIETLEGTMRAEIGDYIIRGVKGELYPCKPDIFDATYEAVEA